VNNPECNPGIKKHYIQPLRGCPRYWHISLPPIASEAIHIQSLRDFSPVHRIASKPRATAKRLTVNNPECNPGIKKHYIQPLRGCPRYWHISLPPIASEAIHIQSLWDFSPVHRIASKPRATAKRLTVNNPGCNPGIKKPYRHLPTLKGLNEK